MSHECVIGLWHRDFVSELVTLSELKEHIIEHNHTMSQFAEFLNASYKERTLKDYVDRRKSTNFYLFDCCPGCGKKIDWKAIRGEDNR